MIEKDIERRLKHRVEAAVKGAKCLKFESPGYTGVPDRIILLPCGTAIFVELKAPHKVERPRQVQVQKEFRNLNFKVFSHVDSYEAVEKVVRYCEACMKLSETLKEALNGV